MLFKSATGDLSNNEDCFLCSLSKNLWQNPKKIVYSSIAQSVERMTVNHDVTGSSPVGGATKRVDYLICSLFSSINKSMLLCCISDIRCF